MKRFMIDTDLGRYFAEGETVKEARRVFALHFKVSGEPKPRQANFQEVDYIPDDEVSLNTKLQNVIGGMSNE